MIPPLATARTSARDVQLRGVPVPTQRSGREVSTARASRGTLTAAVAGGAMRAKQRIVRSGSTRKGIPVQYHVREMSAITHLIAGVPASDLDASLDWYTRFLGRPPDLRVGDEILWDVDEHATLFIEPNAAQAGAGRITFAEPRRTGI